MFKGLIRSNGIPVLAAARQFLEKLLEQADIDWDDRLNSDDKRDFQIALQYLDALPDQIPTSSFKVSLLAPMEVGAIRYSLTLYPTHLQLWSEQVIEVEKSQDIQVFFALNASAQGEFSFHGSLEQWTESAIAAIDDLETEIRIQIGAEPEMLEAAGWEAAEDDTEDIRVSEAKKLLPAWFIDRMMTDHWQFGLLLTNGTTIAIHQIHHVHHAADGSIWLDVELMNQYSTGAQEDRTLIAPTSRQTASINARHIMAAFELADT